MGASQSTDTTSSTASAPPPTGKAIDTPILGASDDGAGAEDPTSPNPQAAPIPTGREYDLVDELASDLPSVMDDESRRQVEEYVRSCDGGKGAMVACFSTAEYLSLFLRKHAEAAELYHNTCFRPASDRSPNGVEVDGTRAYPPSCFNLGQMRMTGKGRTEFSRSEGYRLFDRACRGGHGGACYLQAKMLASYPGSLGPDVPYDSKKAAELLRYVCEEKEDSVSCFALAAMLLRGDRVNSDADNVSPEEARGTRRLLKRENEGSRVKLASDKRTSLERDPKLAERLLEMGCSRGHSPSCYNLAVMYMQGDEGVEKDDERAKEYQAKTEELVKQFGGFGVGNM
ncbi:hypothetical protein ACHAWF_003554 [Thalassiosira exigua]